MSATTTPVVTLSPNYDGCNGFTVAGYVEDASAQYATDVLTHLVGDVREAEGLMADAERAYWSAR